MKTIGLKTFEDIRQSFNDRFELWGGDSTRPSDFVIGEQYPGSDILIFVRAYDPRSGGMFVVEADGAPKLVVIKATMSGGKYANSWFERGERLKYFLKDINGKFGEHFAANKAILDTPGLPILTFARDESTDRFTFYGAFRYQAIHREVDGSKWFELVRDMDNSLSNAMRASVADQLLKRQVQEALALPHRELEARANNAPPLPRKFVTQVTAFQRDPFVIAAALRRANGTCDMCKAPAPFLRSSDGSPYLEVHHIRRLADDGQDTLENVQALCPNCHRASHHG
ncbi:hypothetical protein GCM10007242_44850 [Pigmentiphaga litoralis]|nr:hypothetical protein GCM10007242_44850 [Pigmentiphaga litoralis]